MLTLITTPKPLDVPANRVAFLNAIRSWVRIEPQPEILVFGGDRNLIEAEGGRWVGEFEATANGNPYFNSFIRTAEQLASNDILMYITDHLILTYDVSATVQLIDARFPGPFVVVGRRWDLNLSGPLQFNTGWEDMLRQRAIHGGKYQSVGAKDYVLFRRPFPLEISPFIVGYPWYDTWMVVAAMQAEIPTIDASRAIFPIHQNHGFIQGSIQKREDTLETQHNAQLAAGMGNQGHTIHASHVITVFDILSRERLRREEHAE